MRKHFIFLLLFCATVAFGKNDSTAVFQGYSGGMMLHGGFLFGKNLEAVLPSGESISPQGLTYGIGGSLRVNLWKHLRVGCEGFVSTMKSDVTDMKPILESGSYLRTGWGGLLADACWRMEKVWPFIGASVGGGAMRSLSVVEGNELDWMPEELAILTKQSFAYVNPYIGMDWCLTQRIHMTFRLDWMLAFAKTNLLMPTGPRLYVGFMFCH